MGILTSTIAAEVAGLLAWKPPVDVVATSNIASLSGLQTIDSITGAEGLHVLLTAQTTGSQNGVWVMSAGAWVRRSDMDLSSECIIGTSWRITRGSQAGTRWYLAGPVGVVITLGTTSLTVSQESAAASGTSFTATSFLAAGTAPYATLGEIRLPNAFAIRKRNAANSANLDVVTGSGDDLVYGAGVGNTTEDIGASSFWRVRCDFIETARFDSTGLRFAGNAANTGLVRVPNNVIAMAARNAANSNDLSVISTDASDNIAIGEDSDVNGTHLRAKSGGSHSKYLNGTLYEQALFQNARFEVLHASQDVFYSAGGYLFLNGATSVYLGVGSTARIQADGTGIGVFGATPVAKPTVTGSRGGNAALASLLTALANLGWITDSSTA